VERSGTTKFASPASWTAWPARAGWPATAGRDARPRALRITTTTSRRFTNFCTVAFISPHKKGSTENEGLYSELLDPVVGLPSTDPRRKRHPSGQEDPDALFNRDVGKGGARPLGDDNISQIQVIGGDVHSDHRLGAAAAIDGELLCQKPERV